jgi:UDP-glucose 4-epimerase
VNAGDAHPLDGTTGIVTGASGFIGRAVLSQLPAGCHVHAVHRAEDFPAWAETLPASVEPLALDLTNERLADHVPEVDWALLLAARVSTAASWRDPVGELTATAGVTANSVIDLKAGQLVYLSSGSVYETLSGSLSPERVLAPELPYSVGKLAGELLFRSYATAPYWILRFFGAFGPGEPSFKLARRLVEAFSRGETEFAMRGDGTNRLDAMHVDDAANALLRFVSTPGRNEIVDLCQGESVSVRQFAEMAFEAAGTADASALRLKFEGATHERMLGSAAPGQDGIIAAERMSLAEGLRRYAEWFRCAQGT